MFVDLSQNMLAVRISNELDIPPREVRRILHSMIRHINAALLRGEAVELDGVGTFTMVPTIRPWSVPYLPVRRIDMATDPEFQARVRLHVNPDGHLPPYHSRRFSDEECEQFRQQILKREKTIKGLARELGVSRQLVRRIVRSPDRNKPPTKERPRKYYE